MNEAFALKAAVFHLDGVGSIGWASNTAAFWSQPDRHELVSGQVLTVFTYDATWDYQERHPHGDELAVVLEGDIDLLLDEGAGETARRLERHQARLIPAGAWHRVAVHEASTILFITPVPALTQHRRIPDTSEPPSQQALNQ
jgi:quercetin dioxygenase-like cupin family protein